jgi:hypothetical protein
MITLNITKKEKNPDYKESDNYGVMYRQSYNEPKYTEDNILSVEVTEEQFVAIRKAVLETF